MIHKLALVLALTCLGLCGCKRAVPATLDAGVTAAPDASHNLGASGNYAYPIGPSGASAHTVVLSQGNGAATATGTLAAGQLLVGQGASADPLPETITGKVTFTSGGVSAVSLASGDLPNISTAGDVACSGTAGALTGCNVSAITGAAPVNVSNGVLSLGAIPATASAAIRFTNNNTLFAIRNSANTLNAIILDTDSLVDLYWGDSHVPFQQFRTASGGTGLQFAPGGTNLVTITSAVAGLNVGAPIGGLGTTPLALAQNPGAISTAADITISSAADPTHPIVILNNTVKTGNANVIMPNTVGAMYEFDVAAVTFGANSLVFKAGAASQTATVGAASLLSGLNLIRCIVTATDKVACGGG